MVKKLNAADCMNKFSRIFLQRLNHTHYIIRGSLNFPVLVSQDSLQIAMQ